MYAYAAIGARFSNNIDLSSWWNPIGNLMKNRLENSKIITNRVKQYIGKSVSGGYSNTESVYFSPKTTNVKDLDLAMSVGHATDCKITVKKGSKKWFSSKYNYSVTVELSDKYDFDLFDASEKGKIITWINNGLGYYPMNWGILKIYHWSIKHTFNFVY